MATITRKKEVKEPQVNVVQGVFNALGLAPPPVVSHTSKTQETTETTPSKEPAVVRTTDSSSGIS